MYQSCSYTVLVWVISYFYFTWTHLFYSLAVFGGGFQFFFVYLDVKAQHQLENHDIDDDVEQALTCICITILLKDDRLNIVNSG